MECLFSTFGSEFYDSPRVLAKRFAIVFLSFSSFLHNALPHDPALSNRRQGNDKEDEKGKMMSSRKAQQFKERERETFFFMAFVQHKAYSRLSTNRGAVRKGWIISACFVILLALYLFISQGIRKFVDFTRAGHKERDKDSKTCFMGPKWRKNDEEEEDIQQLPFGDMHRDTGLIRDCLVVPVIPVVTLIPLLPVDYVKKSQTG